MTSRGGQERQGKNHCWKAGSSGFPSAVGSPSGQAALSASTGIPRISGLANKALHQTKRVGAPAAQAVVEARFAGEGRCCTGVAGITQ